MAIRGLLRVTTCLLVYGATALHDVLRFWSNPARRSLLGTSQYACGSNQDSPCGSCFLRSTSHAPAIMHRLRPVCRLRFVLAPCP